MSSDRQRSVAVRSFRDVVDVVERRIFRIDRWRIPNPGGLPAAGLGYFVAALVFVLIASRLPAAGELLGALQPALRLIGIPILVAWALCSWQVDGRRPHHALWGWGRHTLSPRTLAGLRRAPAVGTTFAPLERVTVACAGDEPRYRAGRVRGPAIVVLRYPARLEIDGSRATRGAPAQERLVWAKRIRVSGLPGQVRPLVEGHAIRIPDGAEVVFE